MNVTNYEEVKSSPVLSSFLDIGIRLGILFCHWSIFDTNHRFLENICRLHSCLKYCSWRYFFSFKRFWAVTSPLLKIRTKFETITDVLAEDVSIEMKDPQEECVNQQWRGWKLICSQALSYLSYLTLWPSPEVTFTSNGVHRGRWPKPYVFNNSGW